MSAIEGEIKISSLKIGDIDLTNFNQASYSSFQIYENILNPYGAVASINVVDHSDAMGKNTQTMNGSYDKDVEIRFSMAEGGGGEVGFKFKMLQNKNLQDSGTNKEGSGKNKQYEVRCCSPEFLNAQGNYVQENFNTQTGNMVKTIYEKGFKTKKPFKIEDSTKGQLKHNINRERPINAYRNLLSRHVSSKNQSSLYLTFERSQNGNQEFVFTTWEELFQKSPEVTLKQSTTLDGSQSSKEDKLNSIRSMQVPDSFFTPTRPLLTKTSQTTYNLATGKQQTKDPKNEQPKLADGPMYNDVSYASSKGDNAPIAQTYIDPTNNKQKTEIAQAKTKRANFLAHLSQNHGKVEIIGNPKIKLGSMINLDVFKKTNEKTQSGESQFNGKALVVSIKHKINPPGQSPRYLMELGLVKGSFKEGGGGNG